MSGASNPLKRSPGPPFWTGYFIGAVLLPTLLAGLGGYADGLTFLFFLCVGVVVLGPVGGMVLQAAYDLGVAFHSGQFRFRECILLVVIVGASVLAGFGEYYDYDQRHHINPFNGRIFDAAVIIMAVSFLIMF